MFVNWNKVENLYQDYLNFIKTVKKNFMCLNQANLILHRFITL